MSFDSENWTALQELFHLAEETPENERERVLAAHCSDPALIKRALEILRGTDLPEQRAESPAKLPSQTRIGPYTLLRLIGSGGIGTVYLAERLLGGAPQRLALKVLAPHAAGPAFVERFHREQHILASLDHPHITRLLDAGMSETAQPYLVMEFVSGEHLTSYCDANKLTIPQRIEIFLQICNAVAYAHRNLIVHLDLKPSNVLVNQDSGVKLLDFGTSKLVEPDSMATTTVMATPAYASPEQLRNEPVTTACDIYSLGAILYELLSGRRTAESSKVIFERAMHERDPDPLPGPITAEAAALRGVSEARLRQTLTGDLATITARCLHAQPRDRYPSVDALAEDLQRYLEGRAVLTRPQTAMYRLGKFVRRNRRAVAAAAVIAAALIASLGYAGLRQQQAFREGQRALHMQTFLYRLFKLANSNYTGKPAATVPEFLRLGVKVLPSYIKDPADQREAQLALAESMYENGDMEDAQKVFTQTIASARAAGDINSQVEAEAFSGNIAYTQGQNDAGEKLTGEAFSLSRKSGVSDTARMWSTIYFAWNRDNNGFRTDENVRLLEGAVKEARAANLPAHDVADALDNLGQDYEVRGRIDDADRVFRQALDSYGADPSTLCDQSEIYGELAWIADQRGQPQAALALYQHSYDGYVQCSGPNSRGALTGQEYIAATLTKLGRAAEALPMLQGAMPQWRKLTNEGPELAEPLYFLSLAEIETGHFVEAESCGKEMVAVQTGKVSSTDRRFGASHLIWARALAGQHRYKEALPHAQIADKLLSINTVSAYGKEMQDQAHQLLLAIQEKVSH